MLKKYSIPKTDIVIKNEKILELVRGKRVLHSGATGSPNYKDYKNSLHYKLEKTAKFVIGVDIDEKAIEYLRDKYKVSNIIYGNVEEIDDIDIVKNVEWDYILALDIIEHISNIGKALDAIKNVMNKNTRLIITLPNVFSFRVLFNYVIKHKELVDPTHTFWPSYVTFSNLLKRHGYTIESFYFSLYAPPPRIIKTIFKILPYFASGLFFICKSGGG